MASDVPPRQTMRIRGVALWVRDLGRVAAFYRDVLGLEILSRDSDAVCLGAGGVSFLELLPRPDALPDDPAQAGLFHTAILLPSRADLGSWLAHRRRLAQPLDGAADHLVSEAVYLHDPEGNGVEVYADRPRPDWRWTGEPHQRRVVMANNRLDLEALVQGAAPWAGAPPGTCVGHVHLRVGDAGQAARCYEEALGLDVTAAWPQAVFLSSGGYHHHIAANTWHSAGAGPRDSRRAGLAWVSMQGGRQTLASLAARNGMASLDSGLRDPWGTEFRFEITGGASA